MNKFSRGNFRPKSVHKTDSGSCPIVKIGSVIKVDIGSGDWIGSFEGGQFYTVDNCVYRIGPNGHGPYFVGTKQEFDVKVKLGVYALDRNL